MNNELLAVLEFWEREQIYAKSLEMRRDAPRFGGVRMELPPSGIVLEEVERGLLEEALRRKASCRARSKFGGPYR